jgi:acyl-CoA synthetase (NDP forming)
LPGCENRTVTEDTPADPPQGVDVLFEPRSIAVIGASSTPGKWGCAVMRNLMEAGFEGPIFPVNPKGGEIHGLTAYPSVKDVPGDVDLAVIGIPAAGVAGAVDDCVARGVKGAVVVTAGFAEVDDEGRKLQDDMLFRARAGGLRIVGPNCLGLASTSHHLNASLLPYTPGDIGLISQSGNVTVELQLLAQQRGAGFSRFVSIGNQADVEVYEYLDALGRDPSTRVILLFLESLTDGRTFLETARRVSETKPIVVLKVGRTETGTRAALSHTGSLAGSDEVYDAAFRQAGVIRVDRVHELLEVGLALAMLPTMAGNRVAVLTDGGGHGTSAADECERRGLVLTELDPTLRARLQEAMLPQSQTANPIDFAGAADADLWTYQRVAEIVAAHPEVDAVMIAGGLFGGYATLFGQPELELEVAKAIGELARVHQKPFVLHSPYCSLNPPSIGIFREAGIPCYGEVETAAKCLAMHAQRCAQTARGTTTNGAESLATAGSNARTRNVLQRVRADGRNNLLDYEALELLTEYGLKMPRGRLATSPEAAVTIAEEIGWPAVAKICSPDILHKSDAGGVRVGLSDASEVREACDVIMTNAKTFNPEAQVEGVMIYELVSPGVEVVIGGRRDPQFGPVVMFGLGGVFVEILKDVSFRVAPVTAADARGMIETIRGFDVLTGARGQPGCDINALVKIIVRASTFLMEEPEVAELDLNPVMAHDKGAMPADVRVVLSPR